MTGMLAATVLGIFFVPALFVFMERLSGYGRAERREAAKEATATAAPAPAAIAQARDEAAQHARLTTVD